MLTVTKGLTDDIVIQRDLGSERAAIVVSGTAPHDLSGTLTVTISRKECALAGWDNREAGIVANGKWQAELYNLPKGGPYVVTFAVNGNQAASVTVRGVLVGDLWVLAGQSNMEGVGDLIGVEPPSPYVHVLDMANRWHIAEEPLHWLCDSPDSCHCELTGDAQKRHQAETRLTRKKGAGLGLAFANEMLNQTSVPIGLLACAHGGTSMSQWNPELKTQGGASLYGSMLNRISAAGGRVRGVLWYQGESDANPDDALLFADRFKALVAAVREDCGNAQLPFYTVQLGRFVPEGGGFSDPAGWNAIQELQRRLAEEIPETAVLPAIDLELDDLIHIGVQGLRRLGRRMAQAAQRRLNDSQFIPNIRLQNAEDCNAENTCIRVSYCGVSEGGFAPNKFVRGFSLHKPDRTPIHLIYKAEIDPLEETAVLLHLVSPLPSGVTLHYGYGLDPICTLIDRSDMAAPVFGPIEIIRRTL